MLILLTSLALASALATDWTSHALRLSGESAAVRTNAIRSLRHLPDLKGTLRRELKGRKRPLALDVIAALELKDLLPDLSQLSREDEDGHVYLAMNTLIDSVNRQGFVELYQRRLKDSSISMPAQAILLDTLGRLGGEIRVEQVEDFLESPAYEVRRSALYYARLMILRHRKPAYRSIPERALRLSPRQLREQAHSLLVEMGAVK